MIAQVLSQIAPVSLATLTTEASLLTRVDRKYLIPLDEAVALLGMLDPRTRVLELSGARSFAYESVYFDTAERLSYHLAARSRRRRFKLRSRRYGATDTAYLEMKTRGGRGLTVKERIGYQTEHCRRLTTEGRIYSAEALAGIGLDPTLVTRLEPALTTRYHRTTLLASDGTRATIDASLAWNDADGRTLELPGWVIVESKTAGPPSSIDQSLWRRGIRPEGLSKFGTGTAALHPELSSNKWSRLLRGPFSSAQISRTSGTSNTHTSTHLSMKDSA